MTVVVNWCYINETEQKWIVQCSIDQSVLSRQITCSKTVPEKSKRGIDEMQSWKHWLSISICFTTMYPQTMASGWNSLSNWYAGSQEIIVVFPAKSSDSQNFGNSCFLIISQNLIYREKYYFRNIFSAAGLRSAAVLLPMISLHKKKKKKIMCSRLSFAGAKHLD